MADQLLDMFTTLPLEGECVGISGRLLSPWKDKEDERAHPWFRDAAVKAISDAIRVVADRAAPHEQQGGC